MAPSSACVRPCGSLCRGLPEQADDGRDRERGDVIDPDHVEVALVGAGSGRMNVRDQVLIDGQALVEEPRQRDDAARR
jgi:hypothetical protein